jgi:hypothetical protein
MLPGRAARKRMKTRGKVLAFRGDNGMKRVFFIAVPAYYRARKIIAI